jgi:hypothetical protein
MYTKCTVLSVKKQLKEAVMALEERVRESSGEAVQRRERERRHEALQELQKQLLLEAQVWKSERLLSQRRSHTSSHTQKLMLALPGWHKLKICHTSAYVSIRQHTSAYDISLVCAGVAWLALGLQSKTHIVV